MWFVMYYELHQSVARQECQNFMDIHTNFSGVLLNFGMEPFLEAKAQAKLPHSTSLRHRRPQGATLRR